MGQAAGPSALVALCGRTPRLAARRPRTGAAAVPLAAVAMAAQHDLHTAARAHEQAGGMVDQAGPPRGISRGPPERARPRRARSPSAAIHCVSHPASPARCRARRSGLELPRERPAPCPPTTRARRGSTSRACARSRARIRSSGRGWPGCRPAGRQPGRELAPNDDCHGLPSIPLPRLQPEPALYRLGDKTASSPPKKSGS